MTVMSFFCRLLNGRCMQEPRESEGYPKTQTTSASSAPYPPPPPPRVMKIGIIGAGQIGGTLTRRLTALGHKVFVANSRGPETLLDLAFETGATPVSVPDAVRGMDLVIVTIPEKNIPRTTRAATAEGKLFQPSWSTCDPISIKRASPFQQTSRWPYVRYS